MDKQVDNSHCNSYVDMKVIVRNIMFIVFALGIIVCSICNYAISGAFTWSLYPISSIIFASIILFPLFYCRKKQMLISLALISIFIIPFLFILYKILGSPELFMEIGVRAAIITIVYLWMVYFLFLKLRKTIAAAIMFLLAIPVSLYINLIVGKYVASHWIDLGDISIYGVSIFIALLLFVFDNKKIIKEHNN